MSKKVKKEKTVEELLEEALVPVEEQPYEVPENWAWIKLNSFYNHVNEQIQPDGSEDYIGLEDLQKGGGIIQRGNAQGLKSKKVVFKSGDVIYGKLRPYLNKHAYVDFDGIASTDILVYRSKNLISNKLLNHYLGLPHVLQFANANSSGINLPRVSPKTMNSLPFPLPPLNEQKRIADKVEQLSNKIDEAKRLIDEAKETFEFRRAAILDKAFRGELTAEWRKENQPTQNADNLLKYISEKKKSSNIKINTNDLKEVNHKEYPYPLPEGWSWVKLGELAYYVTSGSRGWSKYYSEDGSLFIRTQDINTNKLVLNHVAHMNLPEKVEGKRSLIEENDILTTITGANVGKCALVDFDISEAYVSQSVALTKLVDKRLSKYVHLSLISPNGGGGELKEKAYGIGRPVLSLEDIKNIKIPMAPLIEQKEVINKAEKLLMAEENSMNLINLEKRLDDLRINILSKAFKGKLGTNDLREENSLKSLTEILNGR
ncbi:restriction endonuclease subunit S [Bacillus sp. Cs-700]|uniref:restriction endonuclease subunit S n=1 Tax=Bacillus sp. Cs-700 TaxID=2589818 RepID=UPI001409CCA0|nr:restriction endonuclease subunit S [Bacillus sp. Cs-700]